MARPKKAVRPIVMFTMRFPAGTMERIDKVVEAGGLAGEKFPSRSDFIRTVVERYLDRARITVSAVQEVTQGAGVE
uniref:Uncharacterized protein n=1 Tax=viral metagenome TaxID=1070528 RepID=A0A6M3IJK9_9ZZZZ